MVLYLDPTSTASGYNSTSTVYDISPANLGGLSWSGSPTFNASNGGFWQLNSSNQNYINVPAYQAANAWTNITLAAWVKIGNTTAIKDILSKEGLYKLRVNADNAVIMVSSNGSSWTVNQTFYFGLDVSTWVLVAATAGPNGVRGYINKTLYQADANSFTLGTGASGKPGVDFNVGAYAYNSNNNHSGYFNGSLGPVMTWSRELSASEIGEVYDGYKSNYGLS